METISVRWELGKYHSSSSTSVSSTQLHEGASICSRGINFGQWNGKGGNHLVLVYSMCLTGGWFVLFLGTAVLSPGPPCGPRPPASP